MSSTRNKTTTEQVIEEYLEKDTSYAVMLTAPWGAGKTHFIKNMVFKNLEDIGYKGVWVSLYGITHIDDIKSRILISLYPLISSKAFKGASGLLKALIRTADISKILPINLSNGLDETKKNIKNSAFDLIDLKKIVLCFDDLERANPNMLGNNEVLGYINTLVEDENIKVILIANEDKIEDKRYDEIKEKLIGHTLHFSQDFPEALECILQQTKNATDAFMEDVRKHKHIIKAFMDIGGMNYRTLKYFLSYFQPVAHSLHSLRNSDLVPYMDSLFTTVMKFVLLISIEFKKGKISFRDNKGLDEYVIITALRNWSPIGDVSEQYNQKTVNAYYSDDHSFYFYQSLYDYVTGGSIFIKQRFLREIYHQYNVHDENISEAYKQFNRLAHTELHKLSDKDYILLLKDIIKYLKNGCYQSQDFLTIFYYLTRFGNPLRLSKEKLKNDMLKVLKRNKYKYSYIPEMARFLRIDEKTTNDEYYQPMIKSILEINENIRISEQNEINQTINDLYWNDLNGCYDRIMNNKGAHKQKISLSSIPAKKFFSRYLKSSNLDKDKINRMILITYDHTTGNHEKEDLQFLRDLKSAIEKRRSAKNPSNVSGWLMLQLLENVNYKLESLCRMSV